MIIKDRLEMLGYQTLTASDGQEALKSIAQQEPDAVFLDLQMPRMDGMEVLRSLKEYPNLPVIVITAFGTIEKAVEAIKEGAFDFITKPFSAGHLDIVIKKALECRSLKRENLYLQGEVDRSFPGIIGESQKIKEATEMAKKVALTSSTVLLLGESGVGKEVFARLIHRSSDRSKKPFVAVNCAALRDELLESELFGHEKGSFTGAFQMKRGKLEVANGGTIFLDEIGDLKPELQAKILRVLEEREFDRVGGTQSVRIDIRTIAATNHNLYKKVQDGRFREDLFFRLNVVTIHLPPLRERKEDIPALADFFLERACYEVKKPLMKFTRESMEHLMNYHWPGNVRELRNLIERAVVLSEGVEITPYDLPYSPFVNSAEENHLIKPYHDAVLSYQKEVILHALKQAKGNQSKAAEFLNLQRTYLARLIKKMNIKDSIKDEPS
ncbi:MAG: sigma-54-dependent Fis family transcriptional regulator [Nitrospirae bacterium]|nr:sigma-54-dependent Fis family transcriptional regulator [Nitrospirota bacterium]